MRALGGGALSAVNPAGAKAAMLYALRGSAWNESACGDVPSYNALLVAAHNSAAATTTVSAIRSHLPSAPSGERS
jgi:hypothetical protein